MFWKLMFLMVYFLLVFIGARIFELYVTSLVSLEFLDGLFPYLFSITATKRTNEGTQKHIQKPEAAQRSKFEPIIIPDIDRDSQKIIEGVVNSDEINADGSSDILFTAFESFAAFEEKISKDSDEIWVIQVNFYLSGCKKRQLFTKKEWVSLAKKLVKFGFKTGIFSCAMNERFCEIQKIHSPTVILITPHRQHAKSSVNLHIYSNDETSIEGDDRDDMIFKWIKKKLYPKVKMVHSLSELMERPISNYKYWLTKPSLSFVYKSNNKVAPLLFSVLSFRFKGRVNFYIFKTDDGFKTGNVFAMSSSTLYIYGEKQGEYFNYYSVEFFLRTLHPEVNDIFIVSVILLNMACWLELFLQKGGPIKRLFYYFWGFVVANLFLFSIWLLLIQFIYMPQVQPIIELCLKNFQYMMFSNIAAIIRQDIIQLSKHLNIVLFGFLGYGMLLGYLHYKVRNDRDRINSNSIIDIIRCDIEELKDLFYSLIGFVTPSLRIYRFEEGIERILLRLASPDLWLHSKCPSDYLHSLPAWTYFCSDVKCIEWEHSIYLNAESKQISKTPSFSNSSLKNCSRIIPEDCVICLDIYKCGDSMRSLPCGHCFHRSCIESWLFRDNEIKHCRCPVCRWPTDVEKGLFEVIDLS